MSFLVLRCENTCGPLAPIDIIEGSRLVTFQVHNRMRPHQKPRVTRTKMQMMMKFNALGDGEGSFRLTNPHGMTRLESRADGHSPYSSDGGWSLGERSLPYIPDPNLHPPSDSIGLHRSVKMEVWQQKTRRCLKPSTCTKRY